MLLIQWLLMANVLSWAYKGTLLSTMIAIRYSVPLDTIAQMDESGLPFFVFKGTVMEWLADTDKREAVMRLNERQFKMPWDGTVPEEYLKKYQTIILNNQSCCLN